MKRLQILFISSLLVSCGGGNEHSTELQTTSGQIVRCQTVFTDTSSTTKCVEVEPATDQNTNIAIANEYLSPPRTLKLVASK